MEDGIERAHTTDPIGVDGYMVQQSHCRRRIQELNPIYPVNGSKGIMNPHLQSKESMAFPIIQLRGLSLKRFQ